MQAVLNFLKSNPSLVPASIGAIFGVAAFVFSMFSFWMTRTATLYSDVDVRYMDLLKVAMEDPEFRSADLTDDYKTLLKTKQAKYEIYAFAAWNIVETIIDRKRRFSLNDKLYDTWKPVIIEENRLHRAWLNDPENHDKFKKKFWKFILDNKEDFPCPECKTKGAPCERCRELSTLIESTSERL